MRVRAFLFDFDGLILDTELASRAGWELLYREHGHELPTELWATVVGTTHAPFDPLGHLAELGRHAPRAARGGRRLGRDLHRGPRPRPGQTGADALPRGARGARRERGR